MVDLSSSELRITSRSRTNSIINICDSGCQTSHEKVDDQILTDWNSVRNSRIRGMKSGAEVSGMRLAACSFGLVKGSL